MFPQPLTSFLATSCNPAQSPPHPLPSAGISTPPSGGMAGFTRVAQRTPTSHHAVSKLREILSSLGEFSVAVLLHARKPRPIRTAFVEVTLCSRNHITWVNMALDRSRPSSEILRKQAVPMAVDVDVRLNRRSEDAHAGSLAPSSRQLPFALLLLAVSLDAYYST